MRKYSIYRTGDLSRLCRRRTESVQHIVSGCTWAGAKKVQTTPWQSCMQNTLRTMQEVSSRVRWEAVRAFATENDQVKFMRDTIVLTNKRLEYNRRYTQNKPHIHLDKHCATFWIRPPPWRRNLEVPRPGGANPRNVQSNRSGCICHALRTQELSAFQKYIGGYLISLEILSFKLRVPAEIWSSPPVQSMEYRRGYRISW